MTEKQEKVLEVLNYWCLTEFLNQPSLSEESTGNRINVLKLKKGKYVDAAKERRIEIHTPILLEQVTGKGFFFGEQYEEEKNAYRYFPQRDKEICFVMGSVKRNYLVELLSAYLPEEEKPEKSYSEKESIAVFSFKTTQEGIYVPYSFKISPLIWTLACWKKENAAGTGKFPLDKPAYDRIMRGKNEWLKEQESVTLFLEELYEEIMRDYVAPLFPDKNPSDPEAAGLKVSGKKEPAVGKYVYRCFAKGEYIDPTNKPKFADMGDSHFLDDLVLFEQMIRSGSFGNASGSGYEQAVLDYILAGYEKDQSHTRTVIAPTEARSDMRRFFKEALDVRVAPKGKWPAQFMPGLMQQVAVNIRIGEKENTPPIFSVNGPPGTGKTTLLKEIVASNLVERAKLLAQYDDPDDAFEKRTFTCGQAREKGYVDDACHYYALKNDKINEYSMLVTSCNNAAVENITVDLPKGSDLLGSLVAGTDENPDIARGLSEVHDLFDSEKSQDEELVLVREKKPEKSTGAENSGTAADKSEKGREKLIDDSEPAEDKEEYADVAEENADAAEENADTAEESDEFDETEADTEAALVEKLVKDVYFTRYAQALNDTEDCWGLVSAPLGKKSNIYRYGTFVLKPFLMDYNETAARKEHLKRFRKQKQEFLAQFDRVKKLETELAAYCDCGNKAGAPAAGQDAVHSMDQIDEAFLDDYFSDDEKAATKAQTTNPWFTPLYNREREKLFFYACKLHKEFAASSSCMQENFVNLLIAWKLYEGFERKGMKAADRVAAMPALLQSLFLLTPVISTTFAACKNFLKDVRQPGTIGMLIVDESGQAPPHMAVGSLLRCRRAMIVGDPRQIEPVVTDEVDMIKALFTEDLLKPYKDKTLSVQGFADVINPYGTYLACEGGAEWVGCPLVVHRRCIDPMYTISNQISYGGTMKQKTGAPKAKKEATFILEKSAWINVKGTEEGAKNHFVKKQGEIVLKLLEMKFKKQPEGVPNLFIISPFSSVKKSMEDMIKESEWFKKEPRAHDWIRSRKIGTVHTFQGQGTDEVIFLLGCDENAKAAVSWVNNNIVNVAATRAKFRFYMIGDAKVWNRGPVKKARDITDFMISEKQLNEMLEGKKVVVKTQEEKTRAVKISEEKKPEGITLVGKKSVEKTLVQKTTKAKEHEAKTWGARKTAQKNPRSAKEKPACTRTKSLYHEMDANAPVCPDCGRRMRVMEGRFGPFWSCTGFYAKPQCKANMNMTAEEKADFNILKEKAKAKSE